MSVIEITKTIAFLSFYSVSELGFSLRRSEGWKEKDGPEPGDAAAGRAADGT